MKLDARLRMKWIDPQALSPHRPVKIANQCVFFQKIGGFCSGFSVFDPRDLTPETMIRIRDRFSKSSAAGDSFLQVPDFCSNRIDSLLTENDRSKLNVIYSPFFCLEKEDGRYKARSKVRVINVDDSPVILKLLKHVISEIPYVDLIDQISDSKVATKAILNRRPDFVTMDIQMPDKTGVEVLREVLRETYIPILMVSSLNLEEGSLVFEALQSGAFDYLQKPKAENREEFVQTLKDHVVHGSVSERGAPLKKALPSKAKAVDFDPRTLWCIGSSTGGTQALTQIFTSLPAEIPPTLVVQHIPAVFSRAFADSLNQLVPFQVKEASDGEAVQAGTVYIAPGGQQMAVKKVAGILRVAISDDAPVNRFKPSVDYLFRSVAAISDLRVIAGILTGMGRDGAEGLLHLKTQGAKTFAQDEATSTVYGMPRAATENGAAEHVLGLGEIAETLIDFSSKHRKVG